jgi:hypothetical protein
MFIPGNMAWKKKLNTHNGLEMTITMAFVQFVQPAYGKIDTTNKRTIQNTEIILAMRKKQP